MNTAFKQRREQLHKKLKSRTEHAQMLATEATDPKAKHDLQLVVNVFDEMRGQAYQLRNAKRWAKTLNRVHRMANMIGNRELRVQVKKEIDTYQL